MKSQKTLWRVMLNCMTFAMLCVLFACNEDDPTPPMPEKANGDVNFSIELPKDPNTGDDKGSGTSDDPIIVKSGEDFNLAIDQKSTYTDPDGHTITCEPKAEIRLSTKQDTIYAKDLKTLTELTGNPTVHTSTTGTYPVSTNTTQTFAIGGQDVVFDLSYETYTIVNSKQKQIEMPYVKPNPANLGNSETTVHQTRGCSAVVTGVTVKPLNATRAQTVTTRNMYEVNVQFNLDIESVNTKEENTQTLNFSVHYVGVVETTELNEPVSELSYSWEVIRGSQSMHSPFVKTPKQIMELCLKQQSKYVDTYGNTATSEPQGLVKITTLQDTVWVSKQADLQNVVDITGTVVSDVSATQKFGSSMQEIVIDWSYERAEGTLADQAIKLPYYEFSPVELKNISVEKIPNATVVGREAELYEVTATFSQKMTARELTSGSSEETVEYVVRYIGAVEIELVKVEYRKDYGWIEAHDNIPLTSHLIIYRDRTYSNGETYTDTFTSGDCAVEYLIVANTALSNGQDKYELSNGETIYYKEYPAVITDYDVRKTHATCVPNLSLLNTDCYWDEYSGNPPGKDWSEYVLMGYNDNFNASSPIDGWYFKDISYIRSVALDYDIWQKIRKYRLDIRFYDRFRYLDGRIIDFLDMQMTREFNFRVEDLPANNQRGPAKVFTHDCKGKFLGREFYWALVDTVYQAK